MQNILGLLHFAKEVEDQFVNGSVLSLSFNIKYK